MAQLPDAPGRAASAWPNSAGGYQRPPRTANFAGPQRYARYFGLSRESFRCSLTSEFPPTDITELADPRG